MRTQQKTEQNDEPKRAITFDKAGLMKSKRYAGRADLLGALLEDARAYTFNEVDALLDKFMKKNRR